MYGMKEVCEESGMTYATLKFYCNEGLIPHVKRDKNNRRVFDEHTLNWVKSLTCLKNCNMSIAEMKEYLAMCLSGADTIPARKIMLDAKKAELQKKITALEDAIAYIDWKQNFYDDILSGKIEYVSNLTAPKD